MNAAAPPGAGRGPYLVGLSGGIASGKSTVGRRFAALGVVVIDADAISREVVAPGSALLAQLAGEFGAAILNADGSLDRGALRARIFADDAARQRLNALLHPAIRARLIERARASPGPYVVLEVPLLVEGELKDRVDRVLIVDCPEQVQLARLIERDHETPEQAARMLKAQASREVRLAAADDVLCNTGSVADLERGVEQLHQRYLALAATH